MAKKTEATETKILPGEKIVLVPLSQIERRKDFNARSSTKESQTLTGSWADFKNSIATKGQEQACVVRPNTGKNAGKYPYDLIVGFRRCDAIQEIGNVAGTADPMVKVIIREMSESDAKLLNMYENTARLGFSGPDLTKAIARFKKENPNVSETVIANALGLSQQYVNQMSTASNKLAPKVMAAWSKGTATDSNAGVSAGISKILQVVKKAEVAAKKNGTEVEEEQEKLYNELAKADGDKPEAGEAGMLKRVKADARKQGELFGRLSKAGALTLAPGFFSKHLGMLVNLPTAIGRGKNRKDIGADVLASFTAAAEAGFQSGLAFIEPGPKLVVPKAEKKAKKEGATAN